MWFCKECGTSGNVEGERCRVCTYLPVSPKLVLRTPAGREAHFAVGCPLNRAWARTFVAEDSQFWDSENQVTIQRTADGWFARPNPAAVNETLLNGVPLVESALLREGYRLAVGRASKGIEKSPFTVSFDAVVETDRKA
jgi:hypothetical protein